MSQKKPDIVIIAAVAENGVIGADNDLPWHCPTDFKFFKQMTIGKPLIMGRRTFESIGKPLPNRPNIIVTRDIDYAVEGAYVIPGLAPAITFAAELCRDIGSDEIMIGGGGTLYEQAMPLADRMLITRIHAAPDGDTIFPDIEETLWVRTSKREEIAGDRDSHDMTFEIWSRPDDVEFV